MAMTKGETTGLVIGGVAVTAILGALFWWWPKKDSNGQDVFGDKKKGDFEKKYKLVDKKEGEFGDKSVLFKASEKRCDGVPYNVNLHGEPADVVESMRSLGYTLTSLVSARGITDVKALQTKGRLMNLRGMAGKSNAWIDGKMGACTLLTLEDALALNRDGQWQL